MSQENDRRARNAFKNILGGIAGGAIVASHQQFGFLVSILTGTAIFLLTIGGYRIADELYGHPDGGSEISADT